MQLLAERIKPQLDVSVAGGQKMTVRLEFSEEFVNDLDALKARIGAKGYKELFNVSLTLLEWAVTQRLAGRTVWAIDANGNKTQQLQMQALDLAA